MAERHNHYERAFALLMRRLRVPCIAIDETRRTFESQVPIKSLDFIVTAARQPTLLIDVKGRRLPGRRTTLENWATQDDVASMGRWESTFGADATALLVFVYELDADRRKLEFVDSFSLAQRHYSCLAISLRDYRMHMRIRSPRWRTVSMPQREFERCARPISQWIAHTRHLESAGAIEGRFDCFP